MFGARTTLVCSALGKWNNFQILKKLIVVSRFSALMLVNHWKFSHVFWLISSTRSQWWVDLVVVRPSVTPPSHHARISTWSAQVDMLWRVHARTSPDLLHGYVAYQMYWRVSTYVTVSHHELLQYRRRTYIEREETNAYIMRARGRRDEYLHWERKEERWIHMN